MRNAATACSHLPSGALSHLRVLELGAAIAVPYATRLLADLGADVVKIEAGDGDSLRNEAPFVRSADGAEVGALFSYLNANKRSVSVDADRLRRMVRELVAGADVLVEGLGAGALEAMGIAPSDLREMNPGLAIVRLSPFGQSVSDPPPNGFILQALAGWIEAREGMETPAQVGGRLHEYIAGGYVAAAALIAFTASRQRCEGVDADISLLECAHSALCFPTLTHSVLTVLGAGTNRATLLGTKPCRDGWVGITTVNDAQWRSVCAVVGAPQYADRREELRQGGRARDAFEALVAAWTAERNVLDVVEHLQNLRVPAVPIHDGASIMADPQWQAREFFSNAATFDGAFQHPSFPWRLSATPASIRRPCANRGQHGASLSDLGWDRRERSGVSEAPRDLPLSGIRVLSLGTYWSGASLATFLGAMGADVIKVESIQRPDGWRYNMVSAKLGTKWWERGRYRGTNLNQRSLTLNLDSQEGRDLFARLLTTADVVIENFAASVIGRLGFDWDAVHELNPRTIMVRMPGFGLEGPRREQVGFGPSFAQFAGHSAVTGFPDQPPQTAGGFLDPTVGIHAAVATMAALEARRFSGTGQLVEVPQIEVGACVAPEPIILFSLTGKVMPRMGNKSSAAAPQGVYQAKDRRWVAVSIETDAEWRRLANVIGATSETAAALSDAATRVAAAEQIDQMLSIWMSGAAGSERNRQLKRAGVSAAIVAETEDFLQIPYLQRRDFFQELDHAVVGPDRYPGWPFQFSAGVVSAHRSGCPTLGQHNKEILGGELGLTVELLLELERRNVIGAAPLGID